MVTLKRCRTGCVCGAAVGGTTLRRDVRYRDLGQLCVERDGAETGLGGAKPSTILAVLLMHPNRPVAADWLVDAVWGDNATEASRSTLESHVSRLRKALEYVRPEGGPTTLVHVHGGYRLGVEDLDDIDSHRFDRLAREAAQALLHGEYDHVLDISDRALQLWRGRPYEPASDEEWAAATVSRLEELRNQVREHRAEALVESGNPERALVDLEPLIRELPYRERLWALKMTALYRCGRAAQALETYRDARGLLLEEVGLEPGQELRDLHQRILARDTDLEPGAADGAAIRIVVADDSTIVRTGVVRMLERDGFTVVAEAADADELLEAAREHRPDVVITDIQMPPTGTDDGLRAALEIRATMPDVGVIVLSQFLEDDYAFDLAAGGSDGVGYLLKEKVASPDVLTEAVRRVASGGSAFDQDVVIRLVERKRPDTSPVGRLTPRERDVLALMAAGYSNTGIAAKLVVSVPAVERHVTGIFSKLELSTQDQQHRRVAAVLAYLET